MASVHEQAGLINLSDSIMLLRYLEAAQKLDHQIIFTVNSTSEIIMFSTAVQLPSAWFPSCKSSCRAINLTRIASLEIRFTRINIVIIGTLQHK